MSRLSELLKAKGLAANPAIPANPSNDDAPISNSSKISKGSLSNSPFLTIDHECRIRAMAKRWDYSEVELLEELEFVKVNPAASLLWVELDERQWSTGTFVRERGHP